MDDQIMPQSFINLLENNKNSYCLIFIYFFIIVLVIFITHKIKPLQMDSKPLTSQSLFWLAIGIPVFSFIYFGSFVWYQTNILLTPKGFENFIKYNALPLGLLSLSIPLSALVNNVHRTIQTDTQIRITKRKNEVDFFYSHKKRTIDFFKEELIKELIIDKAEIIKMMNDRAEKKEMQDVHTKISILKPYSAYNKWFPYASENSNNFNLSKEFIDQIHTFWNKIECLLSILLTQDNPHKYIMGMEILIQKSLRTAELPELKKITNNLIITTPLENGQQRSTGIFSNVFLKKLLTLLFNMCNDLFSYTNTTCLKKEKYHYLCKYIDEESLQINILNGSPVKNDDNKKMPSISNK